MREWINAVKTIFFAFASEIEPPSLAVAFVGVLPGAEEVDVATGGGGAAAVVAATVVVVVVVVGSVVGAVREGL